MNTKKTISATHGSAAARERLIELRHALLKLHKALVDSERMSYEKTVGKVKSPNQMLQLLINDPWFAWLQSFSQLIVSMDEALARKEPLTANNVSALAKQTREMLRPTEHARHFSGHYFESLQRDPDVVLAHGETVKLLKSRRAS